MKTVLYMSVLNVPVEMAGVESLPEAMQEEALDFVQFLKNKMNKQLSYVNKKACP